MILSAEKAFERCFPAAVMFALTLLSSFNFPFLLANLQLTANSCNCHLFHTQAVEAVNREESGE